MRDEDILIAREIPLFSKLRDEHFKDLLEIAYLQHFPAHTQLITEGYAPRPGDLVLGRIDRLRLHGRLELPTGRRSALFPGDEYIGCYANRYAPDQFEAEIPGDLSPCNLVAAGGLTSNCVSRHSSVKPASEVTPLGVLADATWGRARRSLSASI